MLQTILDYQVIFFAIGAMGGIGVISKIVSQITSKKLVKAASNMNKSNHSLMRLIRAKFEHACMVTDRVENVGAFVDKYLYEYKVFRIKLYTWRQLEVKTIWLCGILGAAGAGFSYYVSGMNDTVLHYGAMGGIGVVTLFIIHMSTDENYYLNAARVYMVDYLENVCTHRYAKTYQKDRLQEAMDVQEEIRVEAAASEGVGQEKASEIVSENVLEDAPDKSDIIKQAEVQEKEIIEPEKKPEPLSAPAKTKQVEPVSEPESVEMPQREALIREILEEFLA